MTWPVAAHHSIPAQLGGESETSEGGLTGRPNPGVAEIDLREYREETVSAENIRLSLTPAVPCGPLAAAPPRLEVLRPPPGLARGVVATEPWVIAALTATITSASLYYIYRRWRRGRLASPKRRHPKERQRASR